MINKTLIFFSILFHLISFNLYGNEQLSFDVTEIEILDGGDRIIGKNRGVIKSNDGIVIEADEFEFNKIKNILEAKGNILIEDKINKYNFSAQNIIYNINEERIELRGKAEASIDTNYKFSSQNIIILRNDMIISSDVGVTILDNINQTRYEIGKFSYSLKEETLKGEKIFIHTKYNQPFSDKYFFKSAIFNLKNQSYIAQDINIDFKKDIFGNKANDPRFKGLSSSSKGGVTTINKGVFTTCKKNDSCPPWSIQADKIAYDENKKQIIYNNALVKIYDIPVLYFPKFFHPGPTVKRQTGFLVPHINSSNVLGSSLQSVMDSEDRERFKNILEEIGEYTATTIPPFQHVNMAGDLMRCFRYFEAHAKGHDQLIGLGGMYTGSQYDCVINTIAEKRTTPTLEVPDATNYFQIRVDNEVKTGDTIDTIGGRSFFKRQHLQITSHIPAGISQGFNGLLATNNASSYVYIKSDL